MLKNKALQKNIPKDWKQLKISDVATVYSGATPKTSEGAYWNGDIYWVTPKDLSRLDSRFIINTERKITDNGLKSCSAVLIPANSLVMSSRAPIGYLAINKVPVATNQGCKTMTPNKDIDVQYLYYYLDKNIDLVKRLGTGSTFAEVGRSAVESVEVLVPTLLEQKKIAEILSSVDEEIKKVEEVISAIEKLKGALMQKLFVRGEKHNLNDLCSKIIGGGTPSRSIPEYWGGDIPWVTVKDLTNKKFISDAQEKITDVGLENSASNIIPKGNIITSTRMGIGRFYINDADVAINQDLKGLILKDGIVVDFLYYFLLSRASVLKSKGVGSTVKGIKVEELRNLPVLVPSIDDQKRIAATFSSIDEKISINRQVKERLLQLKKGLMQDLLTGKVRTI